MTSDLWELPHFHSYRVARFLGVHFSEIPFEEAGVLEGDAEGLAFVLWSG